MRVKDSSVETKFHPIITAALFCLDDLYRGWEDELVITCGSEHTARHSFTSLHYAIPGKAADIRIWQRKQVPNSKEQLAAIKDVLDVFCVYNKIPTNWLDVVLETTHIHIEFQPKRPTHLT